MCWIGTITISSSLVQKKNHSIVRLLWLPCLLSIYLVKKYLAFCVVLVSWNPQAEIPGDIQANRSFPSLQKNLEINIFSLTEGDDSKWCSKIMLAAAAAKKLSFGVRQCSLAIATARAWSTGKGAKPWDYRAVVIDLGTVIGKVRRSWVVDYTSWFTRSCLGLCFLSWFSWDSPHISDSWNKPSDILTWGPCICYSFSLHLFFSYIWAWLAPLYPQVLGRIVISSEMLLNCLSCNVCFSFCYGLSICVPPNSCVEILTSKGDGISKWGLWEVIRSYGWSLCQWD